MPYLYRMTKKGLRKASQRLIGKTILLDSGLTYDSLPFFNPLLKIHLKKLFKYEDMATRNLYHAGKFESFIKSAQRPGFRYYNQLGNILTLELRVKGDRLSDDM